MYHRKKVGLILPVYNEPDAIFRLSATLTQIDYLDFIVIVDDGSNPSVRLETKDPRFTVVRHPETEGVGAAIRAGIRYLESRVDVISVMAGNGKDDPFDLIRLVDALVSKGADLVQGSRYHQNGIAQGNMPTHRRLGTRLHPILVQLATRKRLTDSTNGFRAFRTSMLKDPRIQLDQAWLNRYGLEPYLLVQALRLGYSVSEVGVKKTYPPQRKNYTKMRGFADWWGILAPVFLIPLKIRS